MFIENKYSKWYFNIVNNAKSRTSPIPNETHHIIPKSLGGTNLSDNLVDLTPREHYICHLLLTKFTTGISYQKMSYALHRITNTPEIKIKSSRMYSRIRKNHSAMLSLKFTGMTIQERFGKPYSHEISDYQKQQISKSNSERIWSDKSKLKMSISQKQRKIDKPESFNPGIPKTTKHKQALSASCLNKFKKSDTEVFNWLHPTLGHFVGTRSQLRDAFPTENLKVSELTKVINPNFPEKSYHGWRLL